MSTRPESGRVALDALVIDAFAAALVDSSHAPTREGMPAPLAQPSRSHLPSAPAIGPMPSETVTTPQLATLLATPERALSGDQAAVERLGRAGTRRDPIAALDPLPWGRDSVTYSTAAVATGREAGIHWPELVAFRLSDDFPGGPFDPMSASAHAADNAAPAAFFPGAAPDFVPPIRAPHSMEQPTDARHDPSAGLPPWLVDPSGVTSARAGSESAQVPTGMSQHDLPGWLEAPPTRHEPASAHGSMPSRAEPRGSDLSRADPRTSAPTPSSPPAAPRTQTRAPTTLEPRPATTLDAAALDAMPLDAAAFDTVPLDTAHSYDAMPRADLPSWLDREPDVRAHTAASSADVPTSAPSPKRAHSGPPSDDRPAWLDPSPTTRSPRSSTTKSAREQPRGIRGDFPALDQEIQGRRLVWLDSAATTQKPRSVIDAISGFYERDNSNVHRGAHDLAARATDAYEAARGKVQRFLGARSAKEIVFTRGTTEAINLVAQAWGRRHLRSGDVVLVTHLEHHSNIVPWIQLCEATGAVLRVVPVDDAGDVRLDAYEAMLEARVKLVSITQVSNALGTIVPVAPMTAMAHRHGARVLIDGAQASAHVPVDVQCIGADFYAFSGHKIYGPTGIGVLYGREEILEDTPPWQGGGSMIEDVTFEKVRYAPLPARFEAGTPSLGDAVGLGAALDYVDRIGRPHVFAHEQQLMSTLLAGLGTVPGLTIVGSPAMRVGAVSFVIDGHTPQTIGQHLNRHGIAVRSGHHCAQPILRRFGHEATVRPSLGIYNDDDDVARLVEALHSLAGSRRSS